MSKILKDADFSVHGNGTRLVQLSADYECNEQEVRARLNSVVTLYRTFSDAKPKQFWLTGADMDALTAAWTQYKADLALYEQAEQARQTEVLAEAYRLAREFKVDFEKMTVTISEESDPFISGPVYTVRILAIGYVSDTTIYTVDKLLHEVTKAINSVEDHITYLENKGGQTEKDQRMIAAYRAVYPLKTDADKAGDEEPNYHGDEGDYDPLNF